MATAVLQARESTSAAAGRLAVVGAAQMHGKRQSAPAPDAHGGPVGGVAGRNHDEPVLGQ
jgi:hypothetical protein